MSEMMVTTWEPAGRRYEPHASTAGDLRLVLPKGTAPLSSYEGGKYTRGTANWRPANRSHDALSRETWDLLLARGRWLGRNNPWCRGAQGTFTANILGEGGSTRSVVRDSQGVILKDWCRQADELYRQWGDYAHVHRDMDLSEMLGVNLSSTIESGTGLLLEVANPDPRSPIPIAFQPIEIDQLDMSRDRPYHRGRNGGADENEIRNGVERDGSGRVVAYWLFTEHPGDGYRYGSWISERFPASRVISLFRRERPIQHLGTTWFAPIVHVLWDSYEYMKHEIAAAKIASYFIAMEKRENWGSGLDGISAEDGEQLDAYGNRLSNLAPQMLIRGGVQDSLDVIRSDRPNSAAVAWLQFMLQMMAAGLGLSYIRFTGDFSQTNFSSSRAADLQDRKVFRPLQKWHAWHVDLEIRERVIDRAIVLGILPIPAGGLTRYMRDRRKWLAAIARLPGWGYVDPQKQVQASITAIEAGLSTWQRELGDLGLDYEEVFQQLAEEHELKEQLGLKLGSEIAAAMKSASASGDASDPADDEEDAASTEEESMDA